MIGGLACSLTLAITAGYTLFSDRLTLTSGLFPSASATPANASKTKVRTIADPLFGIDIDANGIGVITGYYGTLLSLNLAENQWQYANSDTTELLRRVEVISFESVWAVGHRGSILHSVDAGMNWRVSHRQEGIYLRDIAFANDRVGWAIGHEATILATRDGGKSWQTQPLSAWTGRDKPRLQAITIIDENNVVIAGEFGAIAVTSNGGADWRLLAEQKQNTWTALDNAAGRVVAVGLDGHALKIDPVTGTTREIDTGTQRHLFDVSLGQDGNGFIVGAATILALEGMSTRRPDVDDNIELDYTWLHGVKVLNNGRVIAVGAGGLIVDFDSSMPAFTRLNQTQIIAQTRSLSGTNEGVN